MPEETAIDWVLEKTGAAKKPPLMVTPTLKPAEKKDLSKTRTTEVELWHDWKNSGFHPNKLDPLYNSMKNLVESSARTYKNRVEIPTAAIDFEYKKIFADAAKRWDVSKGAALHSWITGQISKRIQRFIKTNQNFVRIPEYRTEKIGKFKAVKADLTERLGHEPDAITIAEESGMSLKEVKRLTKELRKGLIASGDSDDIPQLASVNDNARAEEVKLLIHPQLTKDERLVHEYWFGMFGKPKLRTSQIAKSQGWDDSKVSKLKRSIREKAMPYLRNA